MTYEMQGPMGARTVINGRLVDYFAGCGYLGLQNHPAVRQTAVDALTTYGLANSGGFGSNHPIYHQLEAAACAYFGTEKMLYFASGYLGNAILAQGLRPRYERIFIDEAAHYSVWDGARTAGKPLYAYRHLDARHAATLCQKELQAGERPLLMTDGVFPVSGEIAPLPDLAAAIRPFNGLLCVDDAHATGVLGENGRGTLEHFGLHDDRCYTCHTFSKALGAYGGFIVGGAALIDELAAHANVQEGASRPPLPAAAAATAALTLLHGDDSLRRQLRANVAQARAGLRVLGWALPDTPVPVICLEQRSGLDLARLQADLFDQGVLVAHSTHYTSVPAGGALRIAIFATHTEEQIARLVAALEAAMARETAAG
ncbi:MAG: aminotransferase class I/II-fold pyridoxal phosphate-dependent enzyme [Anaerolineales bacterium]|nr:aminotransferase class I/II-fold pyridoxal phosphate-dependent enzyme [Anaerolineales bacterium]